MRESEGKGVGMGRGGILGWVMGRKGRGRSGKVGKDEKWREKRRRWVVREGKGRGRIL